MSKIEVNQISSQCGSTLTIGQSGDTVTLACGASQTGFGRTGTVNWDTTAKTTTVNAASGNGYFINTTSGAITVNLPAGSAGDIVSLADYAATWQTNNVTVTPNGTDKIGGVNTSVTLNTEGQSVTFVYTDSTQGWINIMDSTSNVRGISFITATGGTVTCCGDYKIHTFTGPGTFTVCSVGSNPVNNVVDYLVVAGGGAGGGSQTNYTAGGGGGAGGFRESSGTATGCYTASPLGACVSALPVTATGYPITVGAGGTGTQGSGTPVPCAAKGSNSVFSTITSTGGGGGKQYCSGFPANANGGSGGGGGGQATSPGDNSVFGQSGNTPPVSPPQGNNGGNGDPAANSSTAGGGGGGATAVGSNNNPPTGGGAGGAGATTSISGSPTAYAGGGGGGNGTAPGGVGGGGAGANGGPGSTGTSGSANTGGGGGGSMTVTAGPNGTGGSGGSGIVIIRYKYQ